MDWRAIVVREHVVVTRVVASKRAQHLDGPGVEVDASTRGAGLAARLVQLVAD
jgi:hypothetical protein